MPMESAYWSAPYGNLVPSVGMQESVNELLFEAAFFEIPNAT